MGQGKNQSHSVYFEGIDGLRAAAVLSVLAYHLNGVLPGGFIGVDVFFVISGFVVANAANSLPLANFKLFITAFYARRLLRIAPALIVCLLVSMIVSSLIVPGGWLSDTNARTGVAAFFGFSNWVLASTAGEYWSPRAEFNPFTHTWSLGVEEQFYLLSPLIFFGWLRGYRRAAATALAVLAALSLFAASWAVLPQAKVLAFYSLHTRFWELAVGVALALGLPYWQRVLAAAPRALQEVLGWLAVAGLVFGFVAADSTAFPWPWALLPVATTAVLMACAVAAPDTTIARLFSTAPASWVGKRSYSLYLWHWPIYVFARWTVGLDGAFEQVAAVTLSFALAMASYRFVEQPVRLSSVAKQLSRIKLVFIGVAALLCAGMLASRLASAQSRISLSVTADIATWNVGVDPVVPNARCGVKETVVTYLGGQKKTYVATGCSPTQRKIFVAGDSHAGAYTALFKRYVRASGASVTLFELPGCAVFGLGATEQSGPPQCLAFTDSVLAEVASNAQVGDLLFLPSLRIQRIVDQWGAIKVWPVMPFAERSPAIAEATEKLLPLANAGVRVVFEAPKPVFKAPPFRCSDWFNSRNPVCKGGTSIPREEVEKMRAPVLESIQAVIASLPRATSWDPLPVLCTEKTCEVFKSGKPLFFDGDHLSGFGNAVLEPSFKLMVGGLEASK
jgi:peptidoglycan/LPS O-acetylase OafA/YrhL